MKYIYKIDTGRRCRHEKGETLKEAFDTNSSYTHWLIQDWYDDQYAYHESIDNDMYSLARFLDNYEYQYEGAEYIEFDYVKYFESKDYKIDVCDIAPLDRSVIKELIDAESGETKEALIEFLENFELYLEDPEKNGFSEDIDFFSTDIWEHINLNDLEEVGNALGAKISIWGWEDPWTLEEHHISEGIICPSCDIVFTEEHSRQDFEESEDEPKPADVCYCPECGRQYSWNDTDLQRINKQYDEKFWFARQI